MQVNFNPAFGKKSSVKQPQQQRPIIIVLQQPKADSFSKARFAGSCCK